MGAEEPGPHWANHPKTENFSAVQDETIWVQDYNTWHFAVHTKTRETGTKPSGSVRDEEIKRKDTEQECARGWKRKKTRGSIRALRGGKKKNRKADDEFGWYCRLWWLHQKSTTVSPQAQACTFLAEKNTSEMSKVSVVLWTYWESLTFMPCMCNFSYPMNLTDLLWVQVKYCL